MHAFRLLTTLGLLGGAALGQTSDLTVAKIMQDPDTWIGASPERAFWTEDGSLYFYWNPQGQFVDDSLYKVIDGEPVQVEAEERRTLAPRFTGWQHGTFTYDADFTQKVYSADGDLYLYDRASDTRTRLTSTQDRETNPRFTPDGSALIFQRDTHLFNRDLDSGLTTQLIDVRSEDGEEKEDEPDDQDAFLEAQQLELFEVLKARKAERDAQEEAREREEEALGDDPAPIYIENKRVQDIQLDPSERFVSLLLSDAPGNRKGTVVQNYVTESGYAEDLDARPKVGIGATATELRVHDLERDTTLAIDLAQLPGAYDVPAFRAEQGVEVDSSQARVLIPGGVFWQPDGASAVVVLRAFDNKDRWIVRLDPETGTLTMLDHQHDEAWIAGPGIPWFGGAGTTGWMPDGKRFYFQSEATGYSHLYTVDVETGETQALTSGEYEVFSPQLSQDGQTWFFTSSEGSPFERHFYQTPADGGDRERLTSMPGNNQVALSPDEETLAILNSYSNRPPELFVQEDSDDAVQITESTTEEWQAYTWRDPEIIRFEASDGVMVPARLYEPETPNGAAVLFVHGAGYLQNVHRWWSGYFREYMFHNLLTDLGYVVLDVDYRASAGYGRDWRTAIYRHMGGRDLQDYVDASAYVQETYDIPAERIGIYGGSYGGFITLMALFTAPESFGAGAALRSVTDWAHYNHVYTSNILNTPAQDSLSFARSSPIHFAEGLEDPLLIAHGIIDTNVQFQDVVRLAQRLIELGKEDWEMAVYPVEGHGFVEPSSWTDEYRRILELFEHTLHADP